MASRKASLRKRLLSVRDAIPAEQAARASARASARLLDAAPIATAKIVAVYAAIRSELDPAPATAALLARGTTVCFPRVVRDTGRLVFHVVHDLGDLWPGTLRIPEPPPQAPVVPVERIDTFVVPGLGFDPHTGARLGWGKGHYDRTLSDNLRAARIGLAFDAQVIAGVPAGEHDLPMNLIVTESRTWMPFT